MNKLFGFFKSDKNECFTENGAISNETTDNIFVDSFFKFIRGISHEDVNYCLDKMYEIDKVKTVILMFQTRDITGGKGERLVFRYCLAWLMKNDFATFKLIMPLVKDYGRFDDIINGYYLISSNTTYWSFEICNAICSYYMDVLKDDLDKMERGETVSLCAKWFPSENGKLDKQTSFNRYFTNYTKISVGNLRKVYLSPLRKYIKLIEHTLTNKQLDSLEVSDYGKIPSQAMLKYSKKLKLTPEWNNYMESLKKGDTKVNVSTLYPHQIVKNHINDKSVENNELVEEMWRTKLNDLEKIVKFDKTLFVSDTSGSMMGDDAIMISLALGMVGSTLSENPFFKNYLMTFSENPSLNKIPDSRKDGLVNTVEYLMDNRKFNWGYNTNLQKIFDVLIEKSKMMTPLEIETYMPDTIFIISDMEFDSASPDNNRTNFEAIDDKFNEAELKRPRIVFWNVRGGKASNFPVTHNDSDTLLLSGSSPVLMKYVLDGDISNPMAILEKIWKDERYSPVVNALNI